MEKMLLSVTLILSLLGASASYATTQGSRPSRRMTITVLDREGIPVPEARIEMVPMYSRTKTAITGTTDGSGICVLNVPSTLIDAAFKLRVLASGMPAFEKTAYWVQKGKARVALEGSRGMTQERSLPAGQKRDVFSPLVVTIEPARATTLSPAKATWNYTPPSGKPVSVDTRFRLVPPDGAAERPTAPWSQWKTGDRGSTIISNLAREGKYLFQVQVRQSGLGLLLWDQSAEFQVTTNLLLALQESPAIDWHAVREATSEREKQEALSREYRALAASYRKRLEARLQSLNTQANVQGITEALGAAISEADFRRALDGAARDCAWGNARTRTPYFKTNILEELVRSGRYTIAAVYRDDEANRAASMATLMEFAADHHGYVSLPESFLYLTFQEFSSEAPGSYWFTQLVQSDAATTRFPGTQEYTVTPRGFLFADEDTPPTATVFDGGTQPLGLVQNLVDRTLSLQQGKSCLVDLANLLMRSSRKKQKPTESRWTEQFRIPSEQGVSFGWGKTPWSIGFERRIVRSGGDTLVVLHYTSKNSVEYSISNRSRFTQSFEGYALLDKEQDRLYYLVYRFSGEVFDETTEGIPYEGKEITWLVDDDDWRPVISPDIDPAFEQVLDAYRLVSHQSLPLRYSEASPPPDWLPHVWGASRECQVTGTAAGGAEFGAIPALALLLAAHVLDGGANLGEVVGGALADIITGGAHRRFDPYAKGDPTMLEIAAAVRTCMEQAASLGWLNKTAVKSFTEVSGVGNAFPGEVAVNSAGFDPFWTSAAELSGISNNAASLLSILKYLSSDGLFSRGTGGSLLNFRELLGRMGRISRPLAAGTPSATAGSTRTPASSGPTRDPSPTPAYQADEGGLSAGTILTGAILIGAGVYAYQKYKEEEEEKKNQTQTTSSGGSGGGSGGGGGGGTGGLTDVTVSSRTIRVTIYDDGNFVDGDQVDMILNGTTVLNNYVLVAYPGKTVTLNLRAGSNTLTIHADNEGTSSPNTAAIEISDVVTGDASQNWGLDAGESGSFTIGAPSSKEDPYGIQTRGFSVITALSPASKMRLMYSSNQQGQQTFGFGIDQAFGEYWHASLSYDQTENGRWIHRSPSALVGFSNLRDSTTSIQYAFENSATIDRTSVRGIHDTRVTISNQVFLAVPRLPLAEGFRISPSISFEHVRESQDYWMADVSAGMAAEYRPTKDLSFFGMHSASLVTGSSMVSLVPNVLTGLYGVEMGGEELSVRPSVGLDYRAGRISMLNSNVRWRVLPDLWYLVSVSYEVEHPSFSTISHALRYGAVSLIHRPDIGSVWFTLRYP